MGVARPPPIQMSQKIIMQQKALIVSSVSVFFNIFRVQYTRVQQ